MLMLNKNLRAWEIARLYAESPTIIAPGIEAFLDEPSVTRRRTPSRSAAPETAAKTT